jgi:hypothetical protein
LRAVAITQGSGQLCTVEESGPASATDPLATPPPLDPVPDPLATPEPPDDAPLAKDPALAPAVEDPELMPEEVPPEPTPEEAPVVLTAPLLVPDPPTDPDVAAEPLDDVSGAEPSRSGSGLRSSIPRRLAQAATVNTPAETTAPPTRAPATLQSMTNECTR